MMLRHGAVVLFLLGMLVGCATVPQSPERVQVLADLDAAEVAAGRAAYEAADEAARRVGARRGQRLDAAEAFPEDFWELLVARFAFAECTEGSAAANWAQWYADRPEYMARVLDRARPWLYDIASELAARDLPGELALLPIVESAYNPFAYSRGQAAGTWQFLSATGREYGLQINDHYDGRRDTWAATRAALDYLEVLVTRFGGDWNLALAAYNGGQGRVHRAIQRNDARGRPTAWHELSLPKETLAYVPKLNGLACLFREAADYGLELPVIPAEPLVVAVELPGPIDMVRLAADAELDLAELVVLNAGLNGHLTSPDGPYHLVIPVDHAATVLDLLPEQNGALPLTWEQVTVRRGDTLSSLAQRHRTTVAALREANGLNGDRIAIGQPLRLPGSGSLAQDPAYASHYAELASLQQRLLPAQRFVHQVRPGESLWLIARNHQVSVSDIQRWNGLGRSTVIRPGQRLQINGAQAPAAATAAVPLQYRVRNGDSLWTIARQHAVSLADLMRWNGLSENSILRPGQQLTIRRDGV